MNVKRCWIRQPVCANRRGRQRLRVVPLLIVACQGGTFFGGKNYDAYGFAADVSVRSASGSSRPKTKRIHRTFLGNNDSAFDRLYQHRLLHSNRNNDNGNTLLSHHHQQQSSRSRERTRRTTRNYSSSTSLNLFFRSKSEANRRRALASETLDILQSPNITLPLIIQFGDNDDDKNNDEQLILRLMVPDDLRSVVPLCVNEFGTGPTMGLNQIPWRDLTKIPAWWDRFYFERMVSWALRAKMVANQDIFSGTTKIKEIVEDPAMLVLCRRIRRQIKYDQGGGHALNNAQKQQQQSLDFEDRVVGMVELSLQPPEFDKNPPAFPIPRWIKEGYSNAKNLGPLQGWVTNLLIAPTCRGIGYSKILMKATEGIARAWGCKYIYLHADADIRSGRVPQKLYESLGYEVVSGGCGNDDFTWAGLDRLSAIRMVDGAALLCFSKRLENSPGGGTRE